MARVPRRTCKYCHTREKTSGHGRSHKLPFAQTVHIGKVEFKIISIRCTDRTGCKDWGAIPSSCFLWNGFLSSNHDNALHTSSTRWSKVKIIRDPKSFLQILLRVFENRVFCFGDLVSTMLFLQVSIFKSLQSAVCESNVRVFNSLGHAHTFREGILCIVSWFCGGCHWEWLTTAWSSSSSGATIGFWILAWIFWFRRKNAPRSTLQDIHIQHFGSTPHPTGTWHVARHAYLPHVPQHTYGPKVFDFSEVPRKKRARPNEECAWHSWSDHEKKVQRSEYHCYYLVILLKSSIPSRHLPEVNSFLKKRRLHLYRFGILDEVIHFALKVFLFPYFFLIARVSMF